MIITQHPCLQPSAALDVPLVLLHGWGCDSRCWEPLLAVLCQWTQVNTLDLDYRAHTPDSVCAQLLDKLPPRCLLMGWSLGGMIATRLACCAPERVQGLIALATNSQFVADERWPTAMAPDTFDAFSAAATKEPAALLQRFATLVTLGDRHARAQRRWLSQRLLAEDPQTLRAGLSLLAAFDNRDCLSHLPMPAVFYFGERDALVPAAAAAKLQSLLTGGDRQTVRMLADTGHLLHVPAALLIDQLRGFLQQFALSALSLR
ncbi:MAG: alpha/beta fold hydrolase [Cellvibrionaceae bacterium]|nr:alpha/beta fold hydrolase [Cellvibrionaceae bacterium]